MLENEPDRDVTTITVGLKLLTLKPIHAKILIDNYDFLRCEKGKKVVLNGWKATGITEALKQSKIQGEFSH